MNDLSDRLLKEQSQFFITVSGPDKNRNKNRYTYINSKNNYDLQDSVQYQSLQDRKKMYHSITQSPDFAWNSQQILQRSMIMEEKQQQPHQTLNATKSVSNTQSISSNFKRSSYQGEKTSENKKKKELNSRIFSIKPRPMTFIYYFSFFFNFLFRVGLIVLLIQLIVVGDGDKNTQQEIIFVSVLLGLQGIVFLFYFLAIIKLLYTKSSDISVYFQKQFYQRPYAEIHMERILRKHFTLKKIVSNLTRLANPRTKFSKDMKIAIVRQQIYMRIQIVMVYIPLAIVFIIGNPWFNRQGDVTIKFNVQLLMAIVVCIQTIHLIFHYLLIYIFS